MVVLMKKRVLVIDDDQDLLEAIHERLNAHHFHCMMVSSPETGFQRAMRWHPNLILLDLNMPKISGLGLLRELKKNPRLSHIPVVILSGISDEEVVREGLELGAVGYLNKTCGARVLVSTLKSYMTETGVSH